MAIQGKNYFEDCEITHWIPKTKVCISKNNDVLDSWGKENYRLMQLGAQISRVHVGESLHHDPPVGLQLLQTCKQNLRS
jgi:hypothetical protein